MKTYRAYPLNEAGKILSPPHVLEAVDDEAAVEAARRSLDGHDVEIWQDARLVSALRHPRNRPVDHEPASRDLTPPDS